MRAAIALAACGMLAAQSIDRTKPPETGPLRDFKLPATTDGTLPNGFKVVLVEDGRYPMVELRLGFFAGSRYDPADLPGLSETVASLVVEGTASRTARQFAEESAAIGAGISASSSSDSLIVTANSPSAQFGALLELIADMAVNASFPESEVRLRKQNRLEELKDQRSQPDVLANEKLHHVVFGRHPYSKTLPTEASIGKLDRAAILKFRDAYLRPNNAAMVLVGRFENTKTVWRMLEQKFGKWERKDPPTESKAEIPEPARSISLVDRPGSVQADIQMARVAIPRTHADWFPLVVANSILGGGTSSRLFNDVREKRGFAYNVHSEAEALRDSGIAGALMQVRNEVAEPAIRAMLEHFEKMGSERVTAQELSDVKNYLSGTFVLGLAKPSGVADQLLKTRLNGLTNAYLETYVDKIRRVEPDRIQAVSKKYFDPSRASIVVVGDAKAIKAAVEKVGPVTMDEAR